MTEELKDLPPVPTKLDDSALRLLRAFRERLQTLMDKRGDPLNAAVLRRDLIERGFADESLNPITGSVPGPAGPPGPAGAPAPGTTPDLTPPPTVSDLSVVAGLGHVIVQWTGVGYTQGHGNKATHIYAVKKASSDPTMPTFPGEAGRVASASPGSLTIIALPSDLSIRWHVWAKFETNDGEFSVNPAGGTNGVQATTGKIGNADLGDLIVTADKLSAGTYANINLVPNPGAEDGTAAWTTAWDTGNGTLTVDTGAKTGGAQSFKLAKTAGQRAGAGCTAFPVIPGETYAWRLKWKGSSASAAQNYVRAYEAATKPVAGYVSIATALTATNLVNNGPITTSFTEVKGTYTVPAGIYWVSLGVLNDIANTNLDIWWDDVSLGRQITAEYLAAGSIAAGSAAIADLAVRRAQIELLAIDDARVANMSVAKLLGAVMQVGSFIESTNYTSGPSGNGFRINADGTAFLQAAYIRGLLTAAQINSNGLVIRDLAGVPILGVGTGLPAAYLAALIGGGNLFSNSSFEADSNADGIADNWLVYTNGTTGAVTGALLSGGVAGGKYQRITAANLGTASTDQAGVQQIVELTNLAGKPFVFSAWVRGLGGGLGGMNVRLYIDFYAAAGGTGGFVGAVQNVINTPVTSWVRYELKGAIPASAVSARVYLWEESRGSVAGTTNLDIDALQFEIGEVATAYSPGQRDKVGIDNQITSGNASTFIDNAAIGTALIQDLAVTNAKVLSLNADKLFAGAIRGINVNASSHTTVGSYLTSAASGGAATLAVKDTTDFPASGEAIIIDSTNDRDTISYTGKTATSLTGCSGVLAHNSGATIIPRQKALVIDAATNEMRFFGDRGDGTIEELASIGIVNAGSDLTVAKFGSLSDIVGFSRIGVYAESHDLYAVFGQSTIGFGGLFQSVSGIGLSAVSTSGTGMSAQSSSGPALAAASASDVGGLFFGNPTKGHARLFPLAARPSNREAGQIAMLYTAGGTVGSRTTTPRLMYSDGTNWLRVADDTIFTG